MKFFLFFILCIYFKIAFAQQVPDGIYRAYDLSVLSVDGKVVKFSDRFLKEQHYDQQYLIIDTTDFVPLKLKSAPDTMSTMMGQADQRLLMIQLTDSATKKMEHFTGKHIDNNVAIVISGEAITIHKIREKITGGKLQITRCTDNACDFVYVELQDNVVGE